MTDAPSRDPSPLRITLDNSNTANTTAGATTASAILATAGTSSAQPARTAAPLVNNAEPNNNNVTRWPNDRLPAQTPHSHSHSRIVHVPRGSGSGSGTFSSGVQSLSTSRSPSTAASPHSSRDSSPAGRAFRQQSLPGVTGQGSGMRSRKNSHDASPHRPPSITGYTSSVPSAAAIQRALSAAATPQLQPAPTSEPTSRIARPARGSTNSNTPSEGNTPSWPVSPRLKSPPPSGSRRDSLRTNKRPDTLPPNIVIQNPTPTSSTDALPLIDNEIDPEPKALAQVKSANRGASGAPTLETVQETSGPNTPGNGLDELSSNHLDRKYFDMSEEDSKIPSGSSTPRRSMAAAVSKAKANANNSDSDNGGKKDEGNDPEKTPRPKAPSTRASYSSLRQQKTTSAEPVTRTMTVETETVNSVAQSAIGPPTDRASSRAEHSGTLRAKASNDTIKPSKGRKKASRKAPSINATSGMYDSGLFSPPDTGTPTFSPPVKRRRRRENHFLTLSGLLQQPRSQHSTPNMFSSLVPLDSPVSYGTSESDHTIVPEPSTLQLLRRRSSQWLASYFSNTTSPTKTDQRPREGSTRADIFEDRVKNAMDEETSDDSDETFVYESNPAEPPIRRSRHHSRTPSGASLTSVGAQRDTRQPAGLLSAQKTRSMKFANAYNSADDDTVDRTDGTVRASNARNGGSTVHHHHTGRPSRSNTGHPSILDDDSPFPQLNKVRSLTGLPGRQTQNARMAARNLQATNGNGNGNGHSHGSARKDAGYMSYDLDAEGGDDERTPLLAMPGTVRTARGARRPPTRGSRTERYPRRRQGMLTQFAGCIAIIAMLFLLVFGIVGFLFIITTPLTQVAILEIKSVLASEQEMMFDLKIGAVNPNLLPIQISDVDFDVFAKSKFVGSEKWWREHPDGDWAEEPLPPKKAESKKKRAATIGLLENFLPSIPDNFPDMDGPDMKQTMLLGRVYKLDSPLQFDPSFLKRHIHNSTGGVRISEPGKHTELGGSERWERVLLHEFDLIVRGTLKYTIPLGGRAYAVNVGARITVDPQKDDTPEPGEGKDPEDDGDKKKSPGHKGKSPDTADISQVGEHHDETVAERLKRRVWARLLRAR